LARDRAQSLEIALEVGTIGEQCPYDIAVRPGHPVEREAGAVPPAVALRGHHRRQVLADVTRFVERPPCDAAHTEALPSLSHTVHETREGHKTAARCLRMVGAAAAGWSARRPRMVDVAAADGWRGGRGMVGAAAADGWRGACGMVGAALAD